MSAPTIVANTPSYTYNARVYNVVDGDTYDVELDLGFDTRVLKRVRLRDVDTREISFVSRDSEEYKRGQVHKEAVLEWFAETRQAFDEPESAWPFVCYSEDYDRGAYGRVLADIWSDVHEQWLSEFLLAEYEDVEEY